MEVTPGLLKKSQVLAPFEQSQSIQTFTKPALQKFLGPSKPFLDS